MEKLIKNAIDARENAYVPYSKFKVGAAILTNDDQVFIGSNVENSSFGLTNCAERTAMFSMIAAGVKPKNTKAIAIVADTDLPVSPCGACRQVMFELLSKDTKIYLANLKGDIKETTLTEMLPYAFEEF